MRASRLAGRRCGLDCNRNRARLFFPVGAGAEAGIAEPLPARLLLLDGAVAGSRLIVVGERGHILVSSDDGASWKQAEVPTRVMLTAIYMHDAETGWAVGTRCGHTPHR